LAIRHRTTAAFIGLVLAIGLLLPSAAIAASPGYTVVASGLHSPRGLSFGPGNILYAAQAGDAAQMGSIIQIRNSQSRHPTVRTVLGGIPTLGEMGDFIGIDGISVRGRGVNQSIYGIMGLSPTPTGNNAFGALIKVDNKGHSTTVANVGAFSYKWTGDHSSLWKEFPDSNPYGVLALPGHIYVTDAGANTLNEVHPDGSIDVLTYFPNEAIRDAIPTCVAKGPDGALYVGTLVLAESFTFGPSAKVYRVDPNNVNLADPTDPTKMSVWASGLWPINGCTFGPDGSFYASELFTNPMTFGGGDVVKIPFNSPTTHTSLTGGTLGTVGGVAVAPNGVVFVADGTAAVPPGGGRIVRLAKH
jgi:glucose/arabinose dehydrogenase